MEQIISKGTPMVLLKQVAGRKRGEIIYAAGVLGTSSGQNRYQLYPEKGWEYDELWTLQLGKEVGFVKGKSPEDWL